MWPSQNIRTLKDSSCSASSFPKYLYCRSSPLVDVPEVNSRIALRTIQKSSNDENDENCNGEAGQSRSNGDGKAPDQNNINTGALNKAFTVRLFLN